MDDYILVKSIDLIEAPEDYLLSNGFKEIESNAYNKRQGNKKQRK